MTAPEKSLGVKCYIHCYALNMILLILNGNESENARKVVRTEQNV